MDLQDCWCAQVYAAVQSGKAKLAFVRIIMDQRVCISLQFSDTPWTQASVFACSSFNLHTLKP
jgi:hypothetical protein